MLKCRQVGPAFLNGAFVVGDYPRLVDSNAQMLKLEDERPFPRARAR